MSLELNKISAAVLVAGLIGMVSGKVADGIYLPPSHHGEEAPKRGYQVEVLEEAPGAAGAGAASGPASIIPLLASADVALGQEISKKCVACHDFSKGGPNKVGPNLWGIVGAKVAHLDNFAYSDGMKNHGGNWDYENLGHFLYNPKAHVPGTKMAFAGVKKDNERAAIVAYLRSLSDSPVALPSAAEVQAAAPKEDAAAAGANAPTGQKQEVEGKEVANPAAAEKAPAKPNQDKAAPPAE